MSKLQALETAIDHIESEYEHRSLTFDPQPPLTYQAVLDGEQRDATPSVNDEGVHWVSRSSLRTAADVEVSTTASRRKLSLLGRSWQAQLIIAAMVGIAVYAAIDGALTHVFLGAKGAAVHSGTNARTAGTENPPKAETSSIVKIRQQSEPSIPIPRNYGVFAITGGQLAELELLQMRIPDQRVAISAVISTPSHVHLPAGRLEFVLFSRELAYVAPNQAMVRVIARIARGLTFDAGGRPMSAKISDAWVVRSNSYPVRIGPVADNPEMFLVRLDPTELVLPAGRYALVLKGAGYDFTLDGPNTDSAHCLERTDAQGAPIYTECRTP